MAIRIYFRHLQMFNVTGAPIIYTGASPVTVVATAGTVPQTEWIDVTNDVSDEEALRLTWTLNKLNNGNDSIAGELAPQRGVTSNIQVEGNAYHFVSAWCKDHVAAPLNAIDVKIEDTDCGEYIGYQIKSSQLAWCEDGLCAFDLSIKQQDEAMNCMKRTLIADNWQGWFKNTGGKVHPRFSYCNEQRPNGVLIMLWYITSLVAIVFTVILLPLILIINIILILLAIIVAVIDSIPGIDLGIDIPDPIGPGDLLKNLIMFYVESAGCGREHPAPLIRDYISNVCMKCGIEVDAVTAPIFFAPTITIETSSRGVVTERNPHYMACYLNADTTKGIRRFRGFNIFVSPVPNNTDFYREDNAPVLALDMFLNNIKGIYNAEWRLKGNKLYFWRKDWYKTEGAYLYDFTGESADRNKILEGICFSWNEVKYPAACEGIYNDDPLDSCGNEAKAHMNDVISFGLTDDNPNYEGILDKKQDFGATKFRLDGVSTDYVYDAMQIVLKFEFLSLWIFVLMQKVHYWMRDYANHGLLLRDDLLILPKILIWDGKDYMNAKAVKTHRAHPNVDGYTSPVPNPFYPFYEGDVAVVKPWHEVHEPQTEVLGDGVSLGSVPEGYYTVQDYLGINIAEQPALLVNYPMYFEPHFQGTLWDWFHWVDDPKRNPRMNMSWSVKLELCCEDLKLLNVLGDASDAELNARVKLPVAYYPEGIIDEIEVVYDPTEDTGRYINLKGTL